MSHVSAGVGEPVGRFDHGRCQVDTLFTHFKAFVIDLAEAGIDIKIPAGDAGVIDFVVQPDSLFETTIAALNTNVFPRLLIHNRLPDV